MEGSIRHRPSGFEDSLHRSGSGLLVRTLSNTFLEHSDEAVPSEARGFGKRLLARFGAAVLGMLMLGAAAWLSRWSWSNKDGQLPLNELILKLVVPAVGSLLTWFLALSPIPTLLQDRHFDRLTVDPTPFPAYFAATFGWCVFSAVAADQWPFVGNFPPMLSFLFCTLSSFRLCKSQPMAERLEQLTLAGFVVVVLMIMVTASSVVIESSQTRLRVAGVVAPSLTCWQALSPCFEAVAAIRKGDASLLSLPLSLAGLLCSCFWTVYGVAISQPAISLPNGTLFLLSAFNLGARGCVGIPKPRQPARIVTSGDSYEYERAP